jgi:DNA-binding NarL/FixJ family response regulator
LPDGDGVSVCRELKSGIDVACLMLTSFDDDEALFDAILAGAAGYVLKQVRGTDLVAAIRTVAAGGSTLDPRAASRVMQRMRAQDRPEDDPHAQLTAQELRILALIGKGLTNRQIGAALFLAEKTVKNYVSSLLAKLGLERRVQAAVLATRLEQRH